MIRRLDHQADERRRALLGEILAAIGEIEIDADDGRLDLASVLLAIGLSMAADDIGLPAVALHLQGLAADWAVRARAEQALRRAAH